MIGGGVSAAGELLVGPAREAFQATLTGPRLPRVRAAGAGQVPQRRRSGRARPTSPGSRCASPRTRPASASGRAGASVAGNGPLRQTRQRGARPPARAQRLSAPCADRSGSEDGAVARVRRAVPGQLGQQDDRADDEAADREVAEPGRQAQRRSRRPARRPRRAAPRSSRPAPGLRGGPAAAAGRGRSARRAAGCGAGPATPGRAAARAASGRGRQDRAGPAGRGASAALRRSSRSSVDGPRRSAPSASRGSSGRSAVRW